MMARSHIVIGLASWIVAAPMLHLPAAGPASIVLAVAGSLLPDIDHPKSWVGRRTRPLSTAIAATFSHRGITHSAIAVIGMVLLPRHAGYHNAALAALAVGYLSHLVADMLTPRGLRLAWPLCGTWGVPLCRTGSPMESVIVAIAAVAAWWVWRHHSG